MNLKKIYNFSKEFIKNKNIKILEVGCGAGGILKYLNDIGYNNLTGIDYDKEQLNFGINEGLNLIHIGNFKKEIKYDFIILSHVLEHLINPSNQIKSIYELLNDNGNLYIEVPSIHSIKNNNYNFDISKYFHIAHVTHFSLNTFKYFFYKNNLQIDKINEEIQSVSSKNLDGKKIKFYSSLNTDFRELVNISNFYEANKVNLFFKKIPKIFHYKLRKLIISFLPNSIYLFIRRIYRKFLLQNLMKENNIAIIPARIGSQRLKWKNLILLKINH